MTRLGDFTVLDQLGQSSSADRYKAMHSSQGGPFFVKVYARLDTRVQPDLLARSEALIGQRHPNLARHLGHGVIDGAPFVVAPYLEGLDLSAVLTHVITARAVFPVQHALMIVVDVLAGLAALHEFPFAAGPLTHGAVAVRHVRVGGDGQVFLTGLTTPRGPAPHRAPEPRFDTAGAAALLYDLIPTAQQATSNAGMAPAIEEIVGRALGLVRKDEQPSLQGLATELVDAARALGLAFDRAALAALVREAMRGMSQALNQTAASPHVSGLPTLEPIPEPRRPTAPRPAMRAPTQPANVGAATAATGVRQPTATRLAPTPVQGVRAPPSPVSAPPLAYTPSGGVPVQSAVGPPPLQAPPVAAADMNVRPTRRVMVPEPAPAPPALAPIRKPAPTRPLLADPDTLSDVRPPPVRSEPTARSSPPLVDTNSAPSRESTHEGTDPDARDLRAEQARTDRSLRALVARGRVQESAVDAAIKEHLMRGGRVVEILVAAGVISDEAVADTLAEAAQRPRFPDSQLRGGGPNPALVKRLPQTYLLARRVLPLEQNDTRVLVAVADPFDTATLEELKMLLHTGAVETVVAARGAITKGTLDAYRAVGFGAVPGTAADARTVLVCTADDRRAQKIGARLAQESMRVEHVVDGTAARAIFKARPPDAVICAHDLPGADAAALLVEVRAMARTAELPFFVLGPRGDDALLARLLDLGADDYFPEPLKLEVLVPKVRRAVGKTARSSAEGRPVPGLEESTANQRPALRGPPLPPPLPTAKKPTAAPVAKPGLGIAELSDLPELPADDRRAPQNDMVGMPTGVMGTLKQMALHEIVQNLEMGRKTARVDIVPMDGEKGMIAFLDGALRYCECGDKLGEEAFFELTRHKEGFFRIHYGERPPAQNIDAPTTFLLLEAMRRLDEAGLS